MERIRLDKRNGECWIATFQNPPINLVDAAMIREMLTIVGDLETDPNVKVIIFRSDDPDFFLAHWDVRDTEEVGKMERNAAGLTPMLDMQIRLSKAPVVSIAEIDGRARGAGSEFALACDMRFGSLENTKLGQPEVGAAVVPGSNPMVRLVNLMGRGRTLEIVLGSDDFGGAIAELYGYINRALPAAELRAYVDAFAARLCKFEKYAIARTKALVDQVSLPDDSVFGPAEDAFMEVVGNPQTQRRFDQLLAAGFLQRSELELDMGRVLATL